MNERIKELARQAWDYAEENNPEPYHDMYDLCLEKFAELIVQECAKIADEGYGSDHFGNGIAGYQLLEHFGIKE